MTATAKTPVFERSAIVQAAFDQERPITAHVGNDRWFTACPYCDHRDERVGAWPIYMTVGHHMVDVHGSQVPGINVGMLP
jgi:hypothetical protein